MAYQLSEINMKTVFDPKGFVEECDDAYNKRVDHAADLIIKNMPQSPIVLLSGPSGSGKTTTSMKIAEALEKKGVGTHYVSMDDYFKTVDPKTVPRTPEGELDLESPLCMDMELLNKHFTMLSKGEKNIRPQVRVFPPDARDGAVQVHPLKKDEIVVFEGIHALNDMITDAHPEAFKLYISARSNVEFNDRWCSRAPGSGWCGAWCGTITSAAPTPNTPCPCGATSAGAKRPTSPPSSTRPTSSSTPPSPTSWP
jgi:uridine kinase